MLSGISFFALGFLAESIAGLKEEIASLKEEKRERRF
jgi:hypothetical protein